MSIILASASPTRQHLLENAGVTFEIIPSTIDERAASEPLLETGAPPDDIAMALAMAKAQSVSMDNPGALVIGSDQTLEFEGRLLTKPDGMEGARRQLLSLSGRSHQLHSAVALARDGEVIWQYSETVNMKMWPFGPETVGRYLAKVGEKILQSVGAYQIEGPGLQLFEKIDGDYFAILGLPLLPVIQALRHEGELAL